MFNFPLLSRSASFDVEPIYTFRAHVGPVLSLAMTSSGEQCFSGGIDSTIQWWNIPSSNVDPYDTYELLLHRICTALQLVGRLQELPPPACVQVQDGTSARDLLTL
ncbi:striatin-3-like isoform X2 [Channa argus]|uniref:striatin-3-like isoform X2 n=1 Tax=Channa argus TaxID=215402 RepID=UPI0035226A38